MKTLLVILILSLLTAPMAALADKMDSETQTQVINRLDRVISRMDRKDSSWVPSELRMADLLAERARLRFMNEVESNCKACKGSEQDRQRALRIYGEILNKLSIQDQGTVLFQMAHLHQIFGENKQARSLYEGLLKVGSKKYSHDIVIRTHAALGDLLFETGKPKDALVHYEIAFKDPKAGNRGLILYRMGWCHFNLDHLPKAIASLEKLARSSDLLVKEMPEGNLPDPAFQNDVLRDLATFYARQSISSLEIKKYQKMMPASQRKELLSNFGDEADRLGQKKAAAEIYRAYLALPELTKEEKLEAYVRLAQVDYDKGHDDESLQAFSTAADAFKGVRCAEDAKCVELQKRMKRYVTELHRSKKVNPDNGVLKAYGLYVKTFPEDTQMALLGAQVAVQLNNADMATLLFRHASRSSDSKLREEALVGEIESAEKSNNVETRRAAYLHYLDINPKGSKSYEVRYQLAHLDYEQKQWAKAGDGFKTLALDKSGPADLRKKAADLSLDCLANDKRDADLEKWSAEFATAFPASRTEYMQISRKAVLNQTAHVANDAKSSKSELHSALEKMQATNLNGASNVEKSVHFHNEIVLAEKSGDDVALVAALNALMDLPNTSATEREQLLARKVAVYEKRLDFRSAYQVALQMKFPKISASERELRLGTLADLAGFAPQKHYEKSLKAGLRGERAASVRSRLVLLSSNPLAELNRQSHELSRFAKIYGDTILIVYARTHNDRAIEKFLKGSMGKSVAGRFIHKQPFYAQHKALDRRLTAHQMDSHNDRAVQKSLKTRIQMLAQADQSLTKAVRLQDFTAQVMALTTVERENLRVVRELFALPIPKGLKGNEQQQYLSLLKQQARPFLYKSKMAGQKLADFWNNQNAIQSLGSDYQKARPELRVLIGQELKDLAAIASNEAVRSQLEGFLRTSDPTSKDLLSARESVRENPTNTREIENLKNLETKIGHPLMPAFLEGRLEQIQKRSVL